MDALFHFMRGNWLAIIGLLIVVAALIMLLIWLRRRRQTAALEPEDDAMPRRALLDAWRSFWDNLHPDGRSHLFQVQHFVVMGAPGSGKSRFISTWTDWEDKAHQFFPSHTDDPNIQFYLATNQVVLELSSVLLSGSSEDIRAASVALWRRLYAQRAPIVLIVLNGKTITQMPPGELRELATNTRAQINLLSRTANEPVRTQLVIFDAQVLPGYKAFAQTLAGQPEHRHQELYLSLHDGRPLEDVLASFHACLPMMLESADAFRAALRFFEEAPKTWLPPLKNLIRDLKTPDPLVAAPALEAVYLVSDDTEDRTTSPFQLYDTRGTPFRLYLYRHHLAAALLFLLVGGGLFTGFLRGLDRLQADIDALNEINPSTALEAVPGYGLAAMFSEHQACDEDLWRARMLENLPLILDPNRENREACREKRDAKTTELFNAFVTGVLAQTLRNASTSVNQRQFLLTLSLIYATPNSNLEALIKSESSEWDQPWINELEVQLGSGRSWQLTEDDIELFIQFNEAPHITDRVSIDRSTEQQEWASFQDEVLRVLDDPRLSHEDLSELVASARQLKEAPLHQSILRAFKADARANVLEDFGLMAPGEEDSLSDEETNASVLELVSQSPLCELKAESDMTIHALVEQIEACAPIRSGNPRYKLKSSSFERRQWEELVIRTNAARLLEEFKATLPETQSALVYEDHPPVLMPLEYAQNRQDIKVDGRYTRKAYLENIFPLLDGLDARLDRMGLFGEPRADLEAYIADHLTAYATQYGQAWEAFYTRYGRRGRSQAEIQLLLSNYHEPSGALFRFLTLVEDNTRLPPIDSEHWRGLQRALQVFEPVNGMLGDIDAPDPAQGPIAAYFEIIEELDQRFREERVQATFAAETPEVGVDLPNQLTIAGQITLAALHNEENTYRTLVLAMLNEQGLDAFLQRPFLIPFDDIYTQGVRDIEAQLEQNWAEMRPRLDAMTGRYPFHPGATSEVTPEELIAELHPVEGQLWVEFAQWLEPVLERRGNKWQVRKKHPYAPQAPPGMLRRLDRLESLTRMLWDSEGEARPLEFNARALSLPTFTEKEYFATDAWLTVGEERVHAFNHLSEYRPVTVLWWESAQAQILLQIVESDKTRCSPLIHQPSDTDWAFFRLLDSAEHSSNVWRWEWQPSDLTAVSLNNLMVRYQLSQDPRHLFRALKTSPRSSQ